MCEQKRLSEITNLYLNLKITQNCFQNYFQNYFQNCLAIVQNYRFIYLIEIIDSKAFDSFWTGIKLSNVLHF